jgi:hypothetical protein
VVVATPDLEVLDGTSAGLGQAEDGQGADAVAGAFAGVVA